MNLYKFFDNVLMTFNGAVENSLAYIDIILRKL